MTKSYIEQVFIDFIAANKSWITPEMFGAKGDATTDDSAAFLAAANYCASSSNRRILKLSKRYLLNQPITMPDRVMVIGTMPFATYNNTKKTNYNSQLDWWNRAMMNIEAPNGFTTGAFNTYMNVGFYKYGVTVNRSRNIFCNCGFGSISKVPEYNTDANTGEILKNGFGKPRRLNPDNEGFAIHFEPATDGWFGECFIRECTFADCYRSIWSSIPTGFTHGLTDSEINGCTVIDGQDFFFGSLAGAQIHHNHIYCKDYAIYIGGENVLIANNYFDNCADGTVCLNLSNHADAVMTLSDNMFLSRWPVSGWNDNQRDFDSVKVSVSGNYYVNKPIPQLIFTNNQFDHGLPSGVTEAKQKLWTDRKWILNVIQPVKVFFANNAYNRVNGVRGGANNPNYEDYIIYAATSKDLKPINEAIDKLNSFVDEQEVGADVNIFNKDDITTNSMREVFVGNKHITDIVASNIYWRSNQVWDVQTGDIVYTSDPNIVMLFYDENGLMLEDTHTYGLNPNNGNAYTNQYLTLDTTKYDSNGNRIYTQRYNVGSMREHLIAKAGVKYMTIQGGALVNKAARDKLMLSINQPLPLDYVPYGGKKENIFDRVMASIPKEGHTTLDKAFVVLTFDAFNFSDGRWDIMNEYGYKASASMGSGSAETTATEIPAFKQAYKKLTSKGWGYHVYSNNTNLGYMSPTAANNATDADWDNYVKNMIDLLAYNGLYNPVAWGLTQGRSYTGLTRALKKYGIKVVRGGDTVNRYVNDFDYVVGAPERMYPADINLCKYALKGAVDGKYGICFTTHGIYETAREADENYGITATSLRSFLEFAKPYVDAGQLEFITYEELYAKYYPKEAALLMADRNQKMIADMLNVDTPNVEDPE